MSQWIYIFKEFLDELLFQTNMGLPLGVLKYGIKNRIVYLQTGGNFCGKRLHMRDLGAETLRGLYLRFCECQ